MSPIRVLLADDHPIVRQGLRTLLEEDPEIDVVGEADDGMATVAQAREMRPDVVVLDVAMPHLNGIEATRRILKDCPTCRVLILSQYDEDERILDAMWAGASGYLLKRAAGPELADGIRAVVEWGAALHPRAAKVLVDAYRRCECAAHMPGYERLTEREREVLILVAEGYTNQQMADMLHVSPKTIDGHRTSLMSKLDLHDRIDLVKYAVRKQLIDL